MTRVKDFTYNTGAPLKRRPSALDANKLMPDDRPAHDWYWFVLSYPPHLVRDYAAQFDLGKKHVVLDPFCGTGTTVVECKKLGICSIGTEVNPIAQYAGRVKTDWSPDPEALVEHAEHVERLADARLREQGIIEDKPALALEREIFGGSR